MTTAQDPKKCLSKAALLKAANGNERVRQNHVGNCAKLNAAPHPYFDGGLVPMTKVGRFTYFSSRNNNFSNRSQKGAVTVGKPKAPTKPGDVALDAPNPDFASFEGQKGSNDVAAFSRIGCFKDERTRDLPMHVMSSAKVEPHMCIKMCYGAGFGYAATQNGHECWCGNHYGRYGKRPDAECNVDCQGDIFYKCGAALRSVVYNTTSAPRFEGGGCTLSSAACPAELEVDGEVTVGSSGAASKTVSVPAGYTCPAVVSKANWLGSATHPDTFAISQTGGKLLVKRTDQAAAWGMNLRIQCTTTAAATKMPRYKRYAGTWWDRDGVAKGADLEPKVCMDRARWHISYGILVMAY